MGHPYLTFLFKLILVGGLFYVLGQKGLISFEQTGAAFSRLDLVIPAYVGMFGVSGFSVLRWRILLRAQGIELSFWHTFQLVYIGNFFNIALPGAVSGDVVKAVYVARASPGKTANALSSMLLDRVAGLAALIFLSCISFVMFRLLHPEDHRLRALELLIYMTAAGGLAFYIYLMRVSERHDLLFRLLACLDTHWPWTGALKRVYEGVRVYQGQTRAVTLSLVLSMCIHLTILVAFYNFYAALDEGVVSLLALGVVIPMGLCVTAIPILPAGIGSGHAAFAVLFSMLGSEQGANAFTLFIIYMVCQGALGGLVYLQLLYRSNRSRLNPASSR